MTTLNVIGSPRMPLWLTILLLLAFFGATLCIGAGNVIMGSALFVAVGLLYGYGSMRQTRIDRETPPPLGWRAFVGVLCVLISLASHHFIPAFTSVLTSFSARFL